MENKRDFDKYLNMISDEFESCGTNALFKTKWTETIIGELKNNELISACLCGGSISNKQCDNFSDIDLFSIAETNRISELSEAIIANLTNLSSVRIVAKQGFFDWLGETFTIFFEDEYDFTIDVGIWPSSKIEIFYQEPDAIILWDIHHYFSKPIVKHVYPFLIQNIEDRAIMYCYKLRKHIYRGHLWASVNTVSKLRLLLMQAIRASHNDWYLGQPHRRIENVLDKVTLDHLNATYPQFNKESIIYSACKIIDSLLQITKFDQADKLEELQKQYILLRDIINAD